MQTNNLKRCVSPLLALQVAAGCSAEPALKQAAENGMAAAAAAVQEPKREPPRLVLALGDSLYAGFGLQQGQSFPAVLERLLDERGVESGVVNAGISGDTTAGGLRRLASTLDRLDRKPDLAIVGLGANDLFLGFSPDQTRRNLDAIITELKRRDIAVLLTGLMAPRGLRHPYLSRFEAIYPDLAKRHDAELEPSLLEDVLTRPEYLLEDGVHPNASGARRMAERVAPLAARSLERADNN
jgi:acyl-CoA thioesterase-1